MSADIVIDSPTKSSGVVKRSRKVASPEEEKKKPQYQHEKSSPHVLREINATFGSKGPRDFQKLRILGRGGVGRVYLVNLKGTDKLYAMKVLKQDEMIARNKVQRVLTEREILATARHPLIIDLYWSFQSHSRLYFVMDYCAGGEFYRTMQMQPHRCLTEDQMRFYAAEVLLALEYLHAIGFVYRDLKPENILLHESGHIRLTDFDLSKACTSTVNVHLVGQHHPTAVAEPLVRANSFVGTEEYLAPEVIFGKGYGASVDWWTFGILMYEMLYGTTPFKGRSQRDTFTRITKTDLKFPDHPRGPVSKECKNLIKRLLHHDPKKRLGAEQGAAEIKAHPFFEKMNNIQLILNQKPPFIPELKGPQDMSFFPTTLQDDDPDDEDLEVVNPDDLDDNHPFKAFVPVDKGIPTSRSRSKLGGSSHSLKSMSSNSKRGKDRSPPTFDIGSASSGSPNLSPSTSTRALGKGGETRHHLKPSKTRSKGGSRVTNLSEDHELSSGSTGSSTRSSPLASPNSSMVELRETPAATEAEHHHNHHVLTHILHPHPKKHHHHHHHHHHLHHLHHRDSPSSPENPESSKAPEDIVVLADKSRPSRKRDHHPYPSTGGANKTTGDIDPVSAAQLLTFPRYTPEKRKSPAANLVDSPHSNSPDRYKSVKSDNGTESRSDAIKDSADKSRSPKPKHRGHTRSRTSEGSHTLSEVVIES